MCSTATPTPTLCLGCIQENNSIYETLSMVPFGKSPCWLARVIYKLRK
jgi:hypothetical protein